MRRCDERTEWGRCAQAGTRLVAGYTRKVRCPFHDHWSRNDGQPDRNYHRKIVLGLLEPTDLYLTEDELRATLHGRSRGDGRRLDAYCLDDQVDPELGD